MIKFKAVKMTNFMLYGAVPTTVRLDQPGTTMIVGRDLDNTTNGDGSNGVGKTTVLNAIVYALYDESIDSDIAKDDLVNNVNKKGMEVALEFEKDNKTYIVVRTRKMKAGAAGNTTTLYEDGEDITLDSSNNTNALIAQIIGMPFELFVRVVAFSATHEPFLKLPVRSTSAANQTDIIEELFDLKTLSEKAEALKLEIKDTEGSLKTHLERISYLEKEAERHKKQLETAKNRVINWDKNNIDEVADVKNKISKLLTIAVEQQREILEQREVVTEARKQLTQKQRDLENLLREEVTIVRDKKHELEHLNEGTCPYCKQEYKISQSKKAEIVSAKTTAEINMKRLQAEIQGLSSDMTKLGIVRDQFNKDLQVQSLEELLQIKNKIEALQSKATELENATNPYIEALTELENIELEVVDMQKVNDLKSLLDHQTFLLKLLTKKDSFVRKALLNKNIPFLNSRLQKYLTDLGLPHKVEFTHEMTASISKFGYPMSFGNLSNGQKARVNIALSFAFRDVLQNRFQFVNICMLDEILDHGLDAIGVQAAARFLKQKAREEKLALFIISHKSEIDSAFDKKMVVELSEGFSSIKYEDE